MTKHPSEFWSRYQQLRVTDETPTCRTFDAICPKDAPVVVHEIRQSADVPQALLSRIVHDVRQLARIKDQRLLAPVEVDTSEQTVRIVYPPAKGESLDRCLTSELPLTTILDTSLSLLTLMDSVHGAGLILRCVTPRDIYLTNSDETVQVLVGGCPPLMLLHGFGIDQSPGEALTYAAPETLGALEHDVRAASDLYSLGILLFQCLTGSPPFTGNSPRDLLFHHVTTPVPDLCRLNPRVPPPLNDIVRRLLQKHPRDRYQSAAGAKFDIEQVRALFCEGDGNAADTCLVLGTRDQRESLIEPAHVGHDDELGVLKSALMAVCTGQSQAVLMTAPSGVGKSRLLREASSCAVADGFRLMRAQGQNQPGLHPLATMQPAIESCIELIRENSDLQATLNTKMHDYAAELCAAVPDLAAALRLDPADVRNRELSDRRIAVALATLLGHVSCCGQPLLLILDDAQWADDLTLAVLDCWKLTDPQQTLVVVSSRPADGLADRLRLSLTPVAEIVLSPLSRQNSDLLLESMAGVLPGEILDTVWEMASGNPFVSSAVLRGLVEGDVLIPTDTGWKVDDDQLRNLQLSGEAAEVLKQRLARLSAESRQLLAVGAVLGKEFSIETAATLAGLSYETAIEQLIAPRDHYLIWEKAADGVCQFAHDQIREAVLKSLGQKQLADIHLIAADYISKSSPDSYFEIACHFDAAGCPGKALPAAVKAASDARRRHALEIAEQQYSIALRSCDQLRTPPSFEILNGMGSVLMLSGRYSEAKPMLEHAMLYANSAVDEAQVSLKLGELAFKRDDKDKAVRLWETALRKLGGVLPPDWLIPVYTLREIGIQTLHSLLPARFWKSEHRQATLRDRLMWQLYSRLAYGYWYLKGKMPLLFVHLRGMNLAETFAPTAELAQAYSEHAPAMSLIPLRRRGIAYGRRSLEIRTALDDVWGQGQSLHFLAIALYAAGRFDECIDVGRRSVRILERAGDFWEKHIAQYQVAASLLRTGRLTQAVQLAREAYDSGIAVGDDQVCGNIIEVWARAGNGDLPDEIVQKELERPRADVQGRAHVLLARGVQLVYKQRFEEAIQAFDEGIRISRKAGITNCYTAPLYTWKATAVRSLLEENTLLIRRARRKIIRRHRRAAWVALLMSLRFQAELPHALRELAWSFILKNQLRRAMYLLQQSIRTAQAQSAMYDVLQSRLMLQQVRMELDYAGAAEELREVREQISAFNSEQLPGKISTSLSLVDRFDSLLESGRKIASAMEPQEIVAAAITASQHLLRSDFCRIVSVGPDGQPENVSEVIKPTVLRSLKSGEAETAASTTREYRSLLVCPILVRGSAVASLIVGNTEIRDLFGDNELRIITYITTICGAALENAEGFRNLRRLNENLESIVADRTAAVEARSHELQKTADSLRETQTELAAARDAAEVANQAKTDFLAHMSHEIRTPIGAVLGFTEILLHGKQPLQNEQRQHLERVHSNGSHLLQLLNDLLDLSRIEAGELTIETLQCQPYSLLTDILASLESRAIDKGLKLSMTVRDRIPETISTDPTRLRQIITNLVGNAIKFTSHGGVDLIVETVPDREQMLIHVRDSGVGIPPAAQAAVFEPFRQADETVNRKFGGTGLGLPISRKLSQALGGDITLTSAEGEGSTFSVTIATGPLKNVRLLSMSEAAATPPESAVGSIADVDLTGIRILVADDTEANREFLMHTLRTSGADVVAVEHGEAAVSAWQHAVFDLILMDMRMPVLDGYAAVEQLRQLGADLPIVALTANSMAEDEVRCRRAGCTGYLTKPIAMNALLKGVAEQLQLKPGDGAKTSCAPSIKPGSPPANRVSEPTADTVIVPQELETPDDPFFRQLASEFVSGLMESLPDIRSAVEKCDADYVFEQAHRMKGTGGTVGLPVITTIGIALENAAREKDFKVSESVLRQLDDTIRKLEQCLLK